MRSRKVSAKTRYVSLALICLLFASALPFLAAASSPADEDRAGETWSAWIDSATTPKTTYEIGETIVATVVVERGPDMLTAVWEGTLVLAVFDIAMDVVHDDSLPVALDVGGERKTYQFTLDLSDAGDYLLRFSLLWMDNSTVDQSDLNLSVVDRTQPPGDRRASITSMETDRTAYNVGDTLVVDVTVERGDDFLDDVWEGTLMVQLLDPEMRELEVWRGAVDLPYGGATQSHSFTTDLSEAGPQLLVATLYWMDGSFVDEWRLNITVAGKDANRAPVAVIDPEKQAVGVPDEAVFDGSASFDVDGRIASYLWDLGDGTFAEGPTATHIYRVPGYFNVTLTVTDDDGATSVATAFVEVLGFDPPPPDKEAWIDSVAAKGTVNQSEPVIVVVEVVRGDDMLDYVWTGTLVLEVLINGTPLTLTEQVALATGGEARSYTFELVLTDPVDHLVQVALYRQDGELMDTEQVQITVLGGVKEPVILGALAATEAGKFSLLGFFIPLYTKLKKDEILDQFTRGKIYGYVMANPGDHYNSIQKTLGIPNGTFAYHLQVLEKEGFIRSARYGTRRCFFPADMRIPEQETALKAGQRLIIEKILEQPGISQKEIADSLGVSPATVSYHVKGLLELGVVDSERYGMRLRYYINPNMVPSPI
jgi:predicted transcriptional regulator